MQQVEIAALPQRCDLLERTKYTFIQKRYENETRIDETKSVLQNTVAKVDYLEIAHRVWVFSLRVTTVD